MDAKKMRLFVVGIVVIFFLLACNLTGSEEPATQPPAEPTELTTEPTAPPTEPAIQPTEPTEVISGGSEPVMHDPVAEPINTDSITLNVIYVAPGGVNMSYSGQTYTPSKSGEMLLMLFAEVPSGDISKVVEWSNGDDVWVKDANGNKASLLLTDSSENNKILMWVFSISSNSQSFTLSVGGQTTNVEIPPGYPDFATIIELQHLVLDIN